MIQAPTTPPDTTFIEYVRTLPLTGWYSLVLGTLLAMLFSGVLWLVVRFGRPPIHASIEKSKRERHRRSEVERAAFEGSVAFFLASDLNRLALSSRIQILSLSFGTLAFLTLCALGLVKMFPSTWAIRILWFAFVGLFALTLNELSRLFRLMEVRSEVIRRMQLAASEAE